MCIVSSGLASHKRRRSVQKNVYSFLRFSTQRIFYGKTVQGGVLTRCAHGLNILECSPDAIWDTKVMQIILVLPQTRRTK